MLRDLADFCQAAEKSVEEYRENKNKPDWCPLKDSIKSCITHLKRNGYIVKKYTEEMKEDSEECEKLDREGESKDCCGCSCSACLVQ